MKRSLYLIFIIILLATSTSYAGISVCRNDQTNEVTNYSLRGNPLSGCHYFDIPGVNETDYNNLRNLLKTVPTYHIKMTGTTIGSIQEMSAAEKTAVNDAIAAATTLQIRTNAKTNLDNFNSGSLYQRAFADITRDEINILRAWITDFKADVAAATNLTDLKTRVAANSDLPDRTLTQLKTSIKSRIDSGQVDS